MNLLAEETSPYLLQHAENPVDWHPWGEEAFHKAREEDKPVLLSIGYSACHWCHVMERESFESDEIAKIMNERFVNIKVDREERPDVDSIYMNYVQMATGQGGWPLTVFLTPDQVPFYGGTYFPPDDRYGRPGFKRILQGVADAYENKRGELEQHREETVERLARAAGWTLPSGSPDTGILDQAASKLLQQVDSKHGGFGDAPKFPSTMALAFLLRYHRRTQSRDALEAVRLSLDEMAAGGIYDQIGGGFARYSVDERWLVPHFEKMLYDNALLARLYLESYQQSGNENHRRVCREILSWVRQEMTHEQGGFFSALDADSEGEEGKFYVWTPEQTEEVLGRERAEVFNDFYDITASGNFEGKSIPNPRYDLERFAESRSRPAEELRQLFDDCRKELYEAREERVRPGLDDKVLAAWNGLMLTAFAEAGWALQDEGLLEAARRNARFLADEMMSEGRLHRTWKNGEAKLNGYLEDYAQVAEGWLALYQATGESEWMEKAAALTERQIELFWDEDQGVFYFTPRDHEDLIVRQKEFFDNATPSGNSSACLNLLKLGLLTGRREFREKAERLLANVSGACGQHPQGFGNWLQAMDFHLGPVAEIVVVGSKEKRESLLEPVRADFIPNKVVVQAEEVDSGLASKIPLLKGKESREATAYVCRDFVCKQPAHSAEELEEALAEVG